MKKFAGLTPSVLLALGVILVAAVWLISGQFKPTPTPAENDARAIPRDTITKVRVRSLTPRQIRQEIIINGRTEPARAVTLRAEIEGRATFLGAEEGSEIKEGDIIARLDMRDLQAQLEEAKAMLRQRQTEYEGAEELKRKDLQSAIHLERAKASLASAKAAVKRIEVAVSNTIVRAPFNGVLDHRPIEIGTYVKSGDIVARILEQNPILAVGSVTQLERGRLVLGDQGLARLITGQVADGKIRYIASEAEEATRTFRVELELANPDRALVAGITTEIGIPVRTVTAYQISPALLSLSSTDELGIKGVDADDIVQFYPVRIIRSTADSLWISGIPKDVRIITVGQGFVRPGERVRPVAEEAVAGVVGAPEADTAQ
ncbi:MAG: efflux RND transporter periplasmic adaptor subunit [Gammaproteobacteria bacterium]|nr:efflux RND transporter periplasmic adaptor subunit [Gammaproteobacteria bacterium]MDH3464935.1 efflux RND transporter periplasmic adaptor subunit [Gammaproteobacteria bacterium]